MNYVHGECLSMLAISHILQQLLIGSLKFYIPYNILSAVLARDNYSILRVLLDYLTQAVIRWTNDWILTKETWWNFTAVYQKNKQNKYIIQWQIRCHKVLSWYLAF